MFYRSHFYVFETFFGLATEGRKYLHGTHKFGGLGPVIRVDDGLYCLIDGRKFQEGGDAPTGASSLTSRFNRGSRL